jgi:hypothetical protein
LARTSLFEVVIIHPDLNTDPADSREVSIFCESATFPSMNLSTSQKRDFGMPYQYPASMEYGPCNMNFYIDDEMRIKIFFQKWIDFAYDTKTNNFRFYSKYTAPKMSIYQLDREFNRVYAEHLINVYPVGIGEMHRAHNAIGLATMNINFAFERIEVETFSGKGVLTCGTTPANYMDKMASSNITGEELNIPVQIDAVTQIRNGLFGNI